MVASDRQSKSATIAKVSRTLIVLALLYLPIDLFATFLVGGQSASPILLISYILVGLAVIFGVTSYTYTRLRLRTLAKE